MQQRADFLKKRIDDTCFALRIYEIYSKKTPSDSIAAEMCEKYRSIIAKMIREYMGKYGEFFS